MKWLAAAVPAALILAGCGGGGGGTGGPGSPRAGTLRADGVGITSLNANVTGASGDNRAVRIYGDQRVGPINDYTSSHRLTLLLNRPVQPATYAISTSQAAGTSSAVYVETTKTVNGYVTTGAWQATGGSVTVNKADGNHVEGSFTLTLRNTATGGVVTLQNGLFNVGYESPPPPTG
jgi:hypothetical protein